MRKKVPGARPPRIKCHVDGEVVAASRRGDSRGCMIRTAVAKARPLAKFIEVDLQFVRFTEGGYRYKYPLPTKAAYNLANFESGEPVEPFTFELRDGVAYFAGGHNAQAGTPSAIRYWARTQGLDVAATGGITAEVRSAYFASHPGIEPTPPKPHRMRSETSRRRVKIDRFYGLKLATGFKPGGEPTP